MDLALILLLLQIYGVDRATAVDDAARFVAVLSAQVAGGANDLHAVVVTWSTSDTSVAKVTQSGVVTAVGEGSATITATLRGMSATATVTVGPKREQVLAAPTIILDSADLYLTEGETARLVYTADERPVIGHVEWRSSDPRIARVTPQGYVTGNRAGLATITGTHHGRSVEWMVSVLPLGPPASWWFVLPPWITAVVSILLWLPLTAIWKGLRRRSKAKRRRRIILPRALATA